MPLDNFITGLLDESSFRIYPHLVVFPSLCPPSPSKSINALTNLVTDAPQFYIPIKKPVRT